MNRYGIGTKIKFKDNRKIMTGCICGWVPPNCYLVDVINKGNKQTIDIAEAQILKVLK